MENSWDKEGSLRWKKKLYLYGLAKWHGKRTVFELTGNTKDCL